MKTLLLNKYQKNSLRLTLVYVDEIIMQIEKLLASGDEGSSLLYGIKDDLSLEEKAQLESCIPRIRKIMAELKEEFDLEIKIDHKSRIIFGMLPHLWEIVADSTAHKMKGYGEVAPGLKEKLDPPIKELGQLIWDMTGIVEPARREKKNE